MHAIQVAGNIPAALHDSREAVAEAAGLSVDEVPFVAELIEVRTEFEDLDVGHVAAIGHDEGTGLGDDHDRGHAEGRAGDGSDEFRDAFETAILPRLDAFRPDLVVISAGFDAHWRDPLASLNLREADFTWATQKLMETADRHAGGRIVSVLEGGYDLDALAKSTAAHVSALMEG